MFTEERHNIILQELKINGIVSVSYLVNILNASESTIRRDLNALDNAGKLIKVQGGAVTIDEDSFTHDYNVNIRQSLNLQEKKLIAKYATSLIKDGDIIYLDAGTTTELIIGYITIKNIIVVTNGIVHAKRLLEKNIKTHILGGEIKAITQAVIGSYAIENLKKYNFTKGFFGTNGINNVNGYTTPDMSEGLVKAEAVKRCKDSYVLADESKLEKISFVTFANIKDASLITNRLVDNTNYNTKVIEVNKND
jgi:DeoR family fructose operon transcriptional repressor